jgi:hypothetical protein
MFQRYRPGSERAAVRRSGLPKITHSAFSALPLQGDAAGRFADDDVARIADYITAGRAAGEVVSADEAHSAQPGTAGWNGFGQ